jgi:hypothetical protein
MVLTGGEKAPEKVAILRSTEPDDTGRFGRFYLSALPAAARLRSPARFRVV